MTEAAPLTPSYVDEHTTLAKCKYFVLAQVWPLTDRLDPRGWLQNFPSSEQAFALQLLNSLLYFRTPLVDRMFAANFRGISRHLYAPGDSLGALQSKWQRFFDNVIVTHVTGELPNPADSGYAYARRARDLLRVSEDRIKSPEDTIRDLQRRGSSPVVFVDDFVGSGFQFRDTWIREYEVGTGLRMSFRELADRGFGPFYYIPIVCTQKGSLLIAQECPKVILQAAHFLDERYSALHAESVLWPDRLRNGAAKFIYDASQRAGIPDDPLSTDHFAGFRSLGLTVAFEEGCPDATLPLMRWAANNWIPLIRKPAP